MKKNYPQNVFVHIPDNFNPAALADKVNRFHVSIIERRLTESDLTTAEKTIVIDGIIKNLKSREVNGIIQ